MPGPQKERPGQPCPPDEASSTSIRFQWRSGLWQHTRADGELGPTNEGIMQFATKTAHLARSRPTLQVTSTAADDADGADANVLR
jgi:hypothetical protein